MKLINYFSAIIIILVVMGNASDARAQLTVNCYPQNLDSWTGSCTSTQISDYSYVFGIGGGGKRGFMKFDISAIPDNAGIVEVKLHYYISAFTNTPAYRITKLALDPITAGPTAIFNAVGLANSNASPNTYYYHTGTQALGATTISLGSTANTDFQSALSADFFSLGLYSYQTSTAYLIRLNGWNQTPKPYLEVTFNPNYNNDIGIQDFASPVTPTCEGDYPIQVNLRNYGVNTVTSAMINWSFNGVSQTSVPFSGSLAPGAVALITLNPNHFFAPGNYTLYAQTSAPNTGGDPNTLNDSKTHIVQVITKPFIATNPTNQSTTLGGNALFSVYGGGTGVTYQWQLSTDNGISFNNISNGTIYGGTTTNSLTITGATSDMTGYLYRCYLAGTCLPDVNSDSAMLIVGNPIEARAGIAYACSGNSSTVPITVTNLININNIKLTLSYNNTGITYVSTTNINPALSGGTWSATEAAGIITLTWTSTSPVTLSSATLCNINFSYVNGDNPVVFTNITPNTCYFLTPTGIQFPTNYINGSVNSANGIITIQPSNNYIGLNGSAIFSIVTTGSPTFQWQVSTNGGTTWNNIVNNSTYSGATSSQLTVANCPLVMNNYQYHCIITGCTNSQTSNAAILSVIKLVKTKVDNYTSCIGNQVIVQVKVWSFDSIGSISLGLKYNNTVLQWVGYQNSYPTLPPLTINSAVTGTNESTVFLANFSISNVTVPDGSVMVDFIFTYLGGYTDLIWDTITPGVCEYSDNLTNILPSDFYNGSVSYAGPVVGSNPPANVTLYATESTSLGVSATGVGALSYQWKFSSNGGTSWSNVVPSAIYSNVNTPTLTITSVPISYNGYMYNCLVTGLCTPALSSATTLTVNPPPIYCSIDTILSCFNDTVVVPINVKNCNLIGSFKLTLLFDNTLLSLVATELNTTLASPGNYTASVSGNKITMTWNGTSSSISGFLLKLKFLANGQFTNSALTWETVPSSSSWFKNVSGSVILSSFSNGVASIMSLPTSYNIMTPSPANGHYCQGGPGVQIGLENSQIGVNYILYFNGSKYLPETTANGIGGGIALGSFTTQGVYTILAVSQSTSCMKFMDGDITVIADAPPSLFNITGGGSFCTGSTTGVSIGLNGSQTGVTYNLLLSGLIVGTLSGTGSTLSFGNVFSPGVYSVVGIYEGTEICPTLMTGTASVVENPYPAAAGTISGTTSVCQGQTSVVYSVATIPNAQNYFWTIPAGAVPVGGTSSSSITLNFSGTASNSVITVSGNNNNCGLGTSSSLPITVNTLPVVALDNFPNVCHELASYPLTGGTPAGGTYSSASGIISNVFYPAVTGLGTFNITYTFTTINGCSNTATKPIVVVPKPEIYGQVLYNNAGNTPMSNVLIKLKNLAGTVLSTYNSDNLTGNYYFKCLENSDYNLEASTNRVWNSTNANSADALFAAQYSVNMAPGNQMTNFRKKAADVNMNNIVNATDALLIMKRWVGTVNYFSAGDWAFDVGNTITVFNTDKLRNVLCIKIGDCNGDYFPPVKLNPVGLEKQGFISPDARKVFFIPVSTKYDMNAAALSIAFDFPYENVDVVDIESSLNGLIWNILDGQIRVAWYDLKGRSFKADEHLFNIVARIDEGVKELGKIDFRLVEETEIVDLNVTPLENVVLNIPEIKLNDGLSAPGTEISLGENIPNPFNHTTTINYSIPYDASVRLSVYNLIGEEIGILVNEKQIGGSYQVTFDGSSCSPGVYLYKLQINGTRGEGICTKTMIISE